MRLSEYQEMSKRTMPSRMVILYNDLKIKAYYDKDAKANYGMGISGEAGEVTDYLKKVLFHGHKMDIDMLTYELGDVLHYVAGLCTMYDLNLEEVATLNIMKLKKRYPDGFSSEKSIERKD